MCVCVCVCVCVCECVCVCVCALLTSLAGSILPNDVVCSMSADFVLRVSRAAELRGVS